MILNSIKHFWKTKNKFDAKIYNFNNKIGSEYGHDGIELTSKLMGNKRDFKHCYQKYRKQKQLTHFVDRSYGSATPTFALTKFTSEKKHNQSVVKGLPKLSAKNSYTKNPTIITNHLKTIVKACVLSVDSSRFLNSPSVHCFPEKQKEDKIGPLSVELKKNDELGHKIDIMKGRQHKFTSHKSNSSIDSKSTESIDLKAIRRRNKYLEEYELLNL